MKPETFDKIFKVCLLVLMSLYVGFYCYSVNNRRYEFGVWGQYPSVRDTKTGDVYISITGETGFRVNPLTKDSERFKLEELDAK